MAWNGLEWPGKAWKGLKGIAATGLSLIRSFRLRQIPTASLQAEIFQASFCSN